MSTDFGLQWNAVNSGIFLNQGGRRSITSFAFDSSYVYVGVEESGVYRSSNNGNFWTSINNELHYKNVHALISNGTHLFAGTQVGGVFRSTNQGNSWINLYNGLSQNTHVNCIAKSKSGIIAGTTSGLYSSTDAGSTWIASGLDLRSVLSLATRDSLIFAGTDFSGYVSTNNGYDWSGRGPISGVSVNALIIRDSLIFQGGEYGFFKSTNFGNHWFVYWPGFKEGVTITSLTVSGDSIFAGTDGKGIFLSTNEGTNWKAMNTGLNNLNVFTLINTNSHLFAGTHDGVFRSTNNGAIWSDMSSGLPDSVKVNSLILSEKNIFAGTDSGVYGSTSIGESWTLVRDGFPSTINVKCLMAYNGYFFAGTDGAGVWKRLVPMTSVNNEVHFVPKTLSLLQNYPNPFNPTTTIRYALPSSSHVKVTIHDILGREIATLVNEEQSAGWKEVQWNAKEVSSGIYFYKLQVDNFVETKKMLVVK